MNSTERETGRDRIEIVSRVCAAVPAGYVVANLLAVALGLILPFPPVHAVQVSLLVSFLIYTIIILRVFHLSSHRRAWLELLVMAMGAAIIILVNLPTQGWQNG